MKKLIFLFVMLQGIAFGQYQSLFGTTSTVWKIMENWSNLDDPSYPVFSLSVADTTHINNEVIYHITGGYFYGSTDMTDSYYVKENTLLGKAWVKAQGDSVWYIFYDLSLNVGDTIANNNWLNVSQSTVDSVYVDALNRKHIRFSGPSYTIHKRFEFIEGIGTTNGLYRYKMAYLRRPTLICQHKNDTLNYMLDNPFVVNCQVTLGLDQLEESSIVLSPNPVTDQLNITLPEGKHIIEAEILNTLGQIVMSFKNIGTPLDVSELESGVYFLRLKGENANYLRQLVKQ
jgi:hypothetical protein